MAPSRRAINGRSPLVNPQRQITSFFTKSSSSTTGTPTPSPSSVVSKFKPKQNPNPSPNLSPSPATPSPPQSKRSKPLLVIGPSQSPPLSSTGKKLPRDEVVDKKIRVYWPLDKSWYEGCVKSYNKVSGQHLVQYDDAEEEMLDLSKEKIEWIDEPVKKFKRLRRVSVIEDEDEEVLESGGDDSADEDWGKNVEKEVVEDISEDMDMDLDDEEDGGVESAKKTVAKKLDLKKRKSGGGVESVSNKKSKSGADVSRAKLIEPPVNKNDSK